MQLESLLLTRDDQVIKVLRRVLGDLGIEVEVCTGADRAQEQVAHRKFDAIIIDCDDVHGAPDVLQAIRKSPSNKTSTAFALINGVTSLRDAFAMGANLALEKPLSLDRARHSFRAAHGLMMIERRRYYRFPIEMPVTLRVEHSEMAGTAQNLSEGGMALHFKSSVPVSKMILTVHFTLPGFHSPIEATCLIAWADGRGHVGLRFDKVPYTGREQMEKWFRQQMDGGKKPA